MPAEIKSSGDDLTVIASDPDEMVESQFALIESVHKKIGAAKEEVAEAQDIIRAADMAKIDDSAGKLLLKRSKHRLLYLEKVQAALTAGYILMPNLPGSVIAIRVKRKRPERGAITRRWGGDARPEAPDALPPGEGQYVKPEPLGFTINNKNAAGENISVTFTPTDFDDEIGLPVEFLKPTVIERTGQAMELKIFDELLVVHDGAPVANPQLVRVGQGDPLVIGRIFNAARGRNAHQRRQVLSFLVAWFVDTKGI